MIVCTNCGNHNEDTDEFCGSCGKFLEWVGERIEQPPPAREPVVEEAPDPVKAGFVDRVRAAVGIDEPARSVDSSVPVGVGGGSLPENDDGGAAAELEAAAAAAAEAEAARQESEAAEEARRAAAAQADAEARAAADAEARASADAEATRRAQEEARAEAEAARMRQQQADAEAKARDEADARRQADEEAARQAEQAREAQLEAERESAREAATAAERAAAEAEAARQAQQAREAAEAAEAARRAEESARAAAEAESRARAEAEAKAREEVEARKKADEEARLRAEDEARARAAADQRAREEEEARKRAAALLARPKPAAMKPTAPVEEKPDPFVTLAVDPAEIVAASPGSVASGVSAAQRPAAQQPAAQQPSAVKQQPRPDPKFMAAEKVIKAGDLVCGQCGEGNDPTRKFCRKCGNSLAQAVAAKKLPWWKRIFGGKKNRVSKEASERDKRKQKAKDASFKAQMAWDSVKKGLLVLMMIGVLGSFAIPTARGEIMRRARGGFSSVQDIFNPQVAPVNAVGVAATTEVPEKPAAHANDLGVNTYWAEAAEGDGVGQQLSFTFAEPTDLTKVLVMAGATDDPENYLNNPRPKELHLVFDTGGSADITLLDEYRKSQGFNLKGAKGVTRVDIVISSVYPGRGGAETGIAEVEFKKKG